MSFSSNNDGDRTDGTLSSPKIAVDSSGTAHIAYIDSQGNNELSSYSRHPDLMYRTIDGGSISVSETIVHGFCQNAGGSTYYQNNVVSVPAITCIGNTAYIGSASKSRYGGASDWSAAYTVFPRSSGSNASFELYYGSSSACERGFKQFAMAAGGTGSYTLYYVSGTTTGGIPAGLHIANGTAVPTFFQARVRVLQSAISQPWETMCMRRVLTPRRLFYFKTWPPQPKPYQVPFLLPIPEWRRW